MLYNDNIIIIDSFGNNVELRPAPRDDVDPLPFGSLSL